jgi:hypothetical protein
VEGRIFEDYLMASSPTKSGTGNRRMTFNFQM